MRAKDYLAEWLADAYGMETSLYNHMTYDLTKVTGHGEIEDKLQEFLDMGVRHLNALDERITALDGETSSTNRGGIAEFMGLMQHAWYASSDMQLVKKYVATYAAARFEVATYSAIVSAARELGDDETANLCQQLLHDDDEMARWLMNHMQQTIQRDMRQRQEAGKNDDEYREEAKSLINADGTLKTEHLYVVFNNDQTARQMEEALSSRGARAQRMQGQEAVNRLRGRSKQPGAITAVERAVKHPMGEPQQAEHYAGQLEEGRIILGIPANDRAEVDRLLPLISQHGGYDVTYFAQSSFEHLGT